MISNCEISHQDQKLKKLNWGKKDVSGRKKGPIKSRPGVVAQRHAGGGGNKKKCGKKESRWKKGETGGKKEVLETRVPAMLKRPIRPRK